MKEEAEALAKVAELEAQIQAKDIELDQYRGISLLNVQVTHKQYGTGVVIAQKDNTIKVRFPDDLEKSFIIHARYAARPTFEDDEQIVAAFTEFERLNKEIQTLQKQLDLAKIKL